MRRLVVVFGMLIVGAGALSATDEEDGDDFEQIPSCGAVATKTDIWQAPGYALRVEGYTQSTRNIDGCLSKLRVESWITGIPANVSTSENYGPAVTIWFSKPVPEYRTWNALANHWIINFGAWLWNGHSSDETQVVPQPAEEDEPPSDDPPEEDEPLADSGCGVGCASPLIFDRETPASDAFRRRRTCTQGRALYRDLR